MPTLSRRRLSWLARWTVCGWLLLATALRAAEPQPIAPQPRSPQPLSLVGWWTIGGSSTNIERRMVGHRMIERGWPGLVQKEIVPFINWCRESGVVPRIALHNPGGILGHNVEAMNFLQYEHAREAGLTWLTEEFEEAIEPLVQQRVEVIAYVGGPHNSKEFREEVAGKPLSYIHERTDQVLAPYLAAGCSIALDNATTQPPYELTHQVATYLKSRGTVVYVEATAPFSRRLWWADRQIVDDRLFRLRHVSPQHPDARGKFPVLGEEDFYTGEIIRFLTNRHGKGDIVKQRAMCRQIVADGHTPMLISVITHTVRLKKWTARSLLVEPD